MTSSESELPPQLVEPDLVDVPPASNQATASRAKTILRSTSARFHDPSAEERSAIAAAFAAKNYVVYGKAFDIVELADSEAVCSTSHAVT